MDNRENSGGDAGLLRVLAVFRIQFLQSPAGCADLGLGRAVLGGKTIPSDKGRFENERDGLRLGADGGVRVIVWRKIADASFSWEYTKDKLVHSIGWLSKYNNKEVFSVDTGFFPLGLFDWFRKHTAA